MTVKESIAELIETLPEPRQRLLLDFVRFLCSEIESREWQHFGLAHLSQAYSDSEPEYTVADVKNGDAR